MEAGEDPVTATVREVREETGVLVDPGLVGPVQWTQTAAFSFRGRDSVVVHEGRLARLTAPAETGPAALTAAEVGNVLAVRWQDPRELVRTRQRCFPRRLAWLLPQLLDGRRVDEPPDDWERGDGLVAPPLPVGPRT